MSSFRKLIDALQLFIVEVGCGPTGYIEGINWSKAGKFMDHNRAGMVIPVEVTNSQGTKFKAMMAIWEKYVGNQNFLITSIKQEGRSWVDTITIPTNPGYLSLFVDRLFKSEGPIGVCDWSFRHLDESEIPKEEKVEVKNLLANDYHLKDAIYEVKV